MFIFDGYQQAARKEEQLRAKVAGSEAKISIAAILFDEDAGSQLYTRLKQEAAERVGIAYQVQHFSVTDELTKIQAALAALNQDPQITGIIVQKPTKKVWSSFQVHTPAGSFTEWWSSLVSHIALQKDVDGLHPKTLQAVQRGDWREHRMVLPATCQAVLEILEYAREQLAQHEREQLSREKIVIIGVSDLLGNPLFFELHNQRWQVELLTRRQFRQRVASGSGLKDAATIVSATGQHHLISGDLLAAGSILIDVGEPKPDIDRLSVEEKAVFLTPVPGGVGPMTVICLLENAYKLAIAHNAAA